MNNWASIWIFDIDTSTSGNVPIALIHPQVATKTWPVTLTWHTGKVNSGENYAPAISSAWCLYEWWNTTWKFIWCPKRCCQLRRRTSSGRWFHKSIITIILNQMLRTWVVKIFLSGVNRLFRLVPHLVGYLAKPQLMLFAIHRKHLLMFSP